MVACPSAAASPSRCSAVLSRAPNHAHRVRAGPGSAQQSGVPTYDVPDGGLREPGENDYAALPGQPLAIRARVHAAHACKYRGADGRTCHNKAAAGGVGIAQPYCRGHTCPAVGCMAPKRSSASHCPDHAPAAGAKKKAGTKLQRGKQASVYLGFNGTSGGGGGGGGNANDSTAV